MASTEDLDENGADGKSVINGKKPRNTFLDHFGKLTSNERKIRLKGGALIIRHLAKNSDNEEDLQYAVGRLVRGLGSSNINSRIGFYTTFSVLLQSSNKYDLNDILGVIQKELKTSSQNLKSENAGVYTGLILICGAVLHAGKFATLDNAKRGVLLQHLVDASTKKSYLGLLAASLIVDSLPKIEPELFGADVLPVLRPQLKKLLTNYTIDQLYLLLKCKEHYPAIVTTKFFTNLIGTPEIINECNIKALVHILLDVTPSKCIAQHPVYAYIAKLFVATQFLPKVLRELDASFEKYTHVKHHVLVVLLRCVVDCVSDDSGTHAHVPLVFGKHLLAETVRHFKATTVKQQGEIKVATIALFNSLAAWARSSTSLPSAVKVAAMEAVMFYPGTFIFEKITGIKVLQHITATLDAAGVRRLCSIYTGVMLAELPKKKNDAEMESWLNLDRVYAAQLIVKLVNHPAMRAEQEWRLAQLQLLMRAALLECAPVSVELARSLRETFFSALDFKFGKLQDAIALLSPLVHALHGIATPTRRSSLDAEGARLWGETVALIRRIEGKSKPGHLTVVFHTLFLHMALQLHNDANAKLAADSLNELFSCYERRKSKDVEVLDAVEAHDDADTDGEPRWIEVVVDLFLNLLSHSSHLLRSVIARVFPHLCKHLTTSAIRQILHVLDPNSEDNPLSENLCSDDDGENGEDDVAGDGEDAESEDDDDDDDGDDSDGSMMDADDMDDVEETRNDKLRQALHQALLGSDDESIDLDEMPDGEAAKLDAALGEAFRRFRPSVRRKSAKQSRDEATLTHFRVRAMDLIDAYLDSPEVTMCNALEIMLPLLQALEFAIRDAHQRPLHDRIASALRKLAGVRSFAATAHVDGDVLRGLLESILDRGSRSALVAQEMGDKIADCCLFVVNCSSIVGGSKGIAACLRAALDTFCRKRDCLTPYALFKNVMASSWERSVALVPALVGHAFDEAIRPFRRRQALELLRTFYQNNRLVAAHREAFARRLAKCEGELSARTVEFLERREYKCKEPFVVGLFHLLSAVRRCCHDTQAFDWAQLGGLVRAYRSGIALAGDGKAAFNRLCGALKVSNVVKMQPTTVRLSLVGREAGAADCDEDSEDAENGESAAEKRKGSREAKRLKKQARTLRMQCLSEGLATKGFNFAEAGIEQLDEGDCALDGAIANGHSPQDSSQSGDGEEVEKATCQRKANGLAPVQGRKQKRKSKQHTTSESSTPTTLTSDEGPRQKRKKKNRTT